MQSTTPQKAAIIPHPNKVTLDDWGPLPEATGAPMATEGKKLWSGNGILEVGIWRCAPGLSHWTFETNESFTIFSGRMTVTQDGGAPVELAADDSAIFPKGWSGTWELHETVLKVYTVF
ncbi:hypothetical protein SAMN04488581_0041 [Mycolicibacterium neoaurum]|uniref:cupin domain-containing protein n=1 Tax=Mycolicibacterium neoaurum TaxID=1795 RepID=UPI000891CE36|nr:cupin domain-containing protein [Mycolicibacterium neoaurum]SDC07288.1 hypothetical protein SAMN04488581_0041 [Mycolicibacterium neoaurum]